MEKIRLFDDDLIVRDSLCTTNPNYKKKVRPSLRLYIKLTDSCLAKCKFCANEGSCDFGEIDLEKLAFVIKYLKSEGRLHGISITGGEPMVKPGLLFKVLDLIYKIDEDMEVAISTNGYNLLKFLDYPNINKLESIHISRHHYDDLVNYKIFGSSDVASSSDIVSLQEGLDDKKIININTMVMKDSIESLDDIKKMMDSVGDMGVYKNGFVSLMKCNDYSSKHFINFNDIFSNLDDNFFLAHHFFCEEYCECVDGLYLTSSDKLIEFYARMVKDCSCPYTTQLVYTTDNRLLSGFGGRVLYK